MDRLKLGIIGCGGIANQKHLPAINKAGGADVLAFYDISEERARKSSEVFGTPNAKVYADYKDLLRQDLDAVYVCTPNRSHSRITVDALNAGKHVMCEKPMALNYSEAQEMLKASRENGKLLNIAYQNRFRADSQYLKKAIQEGALGEIYVAHAHAVRRRAVPTWGVFLNGEEQGGGPLIDIGTHSLDLTLWMMDNYKPRYAVGTTYHKLNKEKNAANTWGDWDVEQFTAEDSAFGFIVMENGATIMLSAAWALNTLDVEEASCTLHGTRGGADFHQGLRINGVKHGRQFVEKPDFKGSDMYAEDKKDDSDVLEQKTFFSAIRGEGAQCVLPEQAVVVTQILEGIYKSAASGQPYYFN